MTGIVALASFLRAERDQRGWDDKDIEAATGLPKSTISNLLNERIQHPDLATLAALAHGLRVPLRVIVERLGYSIEGQPVQRLGSLDAIDQELARIAEYRDFLAQKPEVLKEVQNLIRWRFGLSPDDR